MVAAVAADRAKPELPGDKCFGRRARRFPQERRAECRDGERAVCWGFASVSGDYRAGDRGVRKWSLRIHSSMRSGQSVTGSSVARKPYPWPPLS